MTSTPPKPRRWVMPLLGLSLAANLLVIGLAAGASWRMKDGRFDKTRGGPSAIAYMRALDRDDRRAIFEDLRASRGSMRAEDPARQQSMLEALRADPFDPERVKTVLLQQSQRGQTAREVVEAKWLTVVSEMSPVDRAAYADRLQKAFERRGKGRPKRQGD